MSCLMFLCISADSSSILVVEGVMVKQHLYITRTKCLLTPIPYVLLLCGEEEKDEWKVKVYMLIHP